MQLHRTVLAELEAARHAEVFRLAQGKKRRFHNHRGLSPIEMQLRDFQFGPASLMKSSATSEDFQTVIFREKTRVHFFQAADTFRCCAPENVGAGDVSFLDLEVQWRI